MASTTDRKIAAETGGSIKNVDRRILWMFGVLVSIGAVAAYIYEFQRLTLSDSENRTFVVLLAPLTISILGLAAFIDYQSHRRITTPMLLSWAGVTISWLSLLIIELLDSSRTASTSEGLFRTLAIVPAAVVVVMRFIVHRRAR